MPSSCPPVSLSTTFDNSHGKLHSFIFLLECYYSSFLHYFSSSFFVVDYVSVCFVNILFKNFGTEVEFMVANNRTLNFQVMQYWNHVLYN